MSNHVAIYKLHDVREGGTARNACLRKHTSQFLATGVNITNDVTARSVGFHGEYTDRWNNNACIIQARLIHGINTKFLKKKVQKRENEERKKITRKHR